MPYRMIAGLLVLLALAGTGWYVRGLRAANAELATQNDELTGQLNAARELREVEQKIAKTHVAKIATLRAEQRKTDAALEKALDAERAWADTPVPDAVVDALGL